MAAGGVAAAAGGVAADDLRGANQSLVAVFSAGRSGSGAADGSAARGAALTPG
ncbi:hypothetical protein ACIHFE_05350 [Streptomyces sp. NPDC052396]|uniref:hypothetical protein n=1 Tax=Streptomyces sp. NPDC052396 TaxID=3365689 RepID=UPI0037D2C722